MSDPAELKDYLAVLLKHRRFIGGLTVAASIATFATCLFLPKYYRATATLLVTPPKLTDSAATQPLFSIKTFEELVHNTNNQIKTIQKFGLGEPAGSLTPDAFDGLMKVDPIKDTNVVKVSFEYTDPGKARDILNYYADLAVDLIYQHSTAEGEHSADFFRKQVEDASVRLIKAGEALTAFGKKDEIAVINNQIEANLKQITQWEKERLDTVVDLSVLSRSPAAKKLSTLGEQVVTFNREQNPEQGRSLLRSKIAVLNELEVDRVRLGSQIVALETDLARAKDKLSTTPRFVSIKSALTDSATMATAAQSAGSSSKDVLGMQLYRDELNPAYTSLEQRAAELSGQLTFTKAKHADLEQKTAGLRAEIAKMEGDQSAKEESLKRLERDYQLVETEYRKVNVVSNPGLASKRAVLEKNIAEARAQVEQLNAKAVSLVVERDTVRRDYEIASDTYRQFASKFEKVRMEITTRTQLLSVVDRAVAPDRHARPRKMLYSAVAGIATFLALSVLALLYEYAARAGLVRGGGGAA